MTKLLTQAFEKASTLFEEVQDQLAQKLLEEMEGGGARWDRTLADSQDKLERLAANAAQDDRAGKTRELGFDNL